MSKRPIHIAVPLLALMFALAAPAAEKKAHGKRRAKVESTDGPAVLWRDPTDIRSRNLLYGPGGSAHAPHGQLVFVREDLDGSSPKFTVRDADGVKWKVKLGEEARPETAATRLVWAVGYFADEDYLIPDLHVDDMPGRLKRGQEWILPGGRVLYARLKREPDARKKLGVWRWKDNPFRGSRELNGLRVMMALINNWDLKDENNAIIHEKGGGEDVYEISDLGASFGVNGLERHREIKKGSLRFFERSGFIRDEHDGVVDFATPQRACTPCAVALPEFFRRLHLVWIGRDIPREDARWTGSLLTRLSADQLHDAFRAAGYSADQVDGFVRILEQRIAELNKL